MEFNNKQEGKRERKKWEGVGCVDPGGQTNDEGGLLSFPIQ